MPTKPVGGSSDLPPDIEFESETPKAIRREQLKKETLAVMVRARFYDALEEYAVGSAYRALFESKRVNSAFLPDLKKAFLDLLDECELLGMERLTAAHIAWLGRLRNDVAKERFSASAWEIAQLAQFGAEVGEHEQRRQLADIESGFSSVREGIGLNIFWGNLRLGSPLGWSISLTQLARAKESGWPEYPEMHEAFLSAIDRELSRPAAEIEKNLLEEITKMKTAVAAW